MHELIRIAAAATVFAFLAVGPVAAAPLDLDTTTPIISGFSPDLPGQTPDGDPVFESYFGTLDLLTLTGAVPLAINADITMSVAETGSGVLLGDFSIDGLDGFSPDPFLSSVDLLSFDFGLGRATLLFGNLLGSGASLFGSEVFITVRERGANDTNAGPGSNLTVENVAPVPLPATSPLLAAGLGVLVLARRRKTLRG